jgi:porin
LGIWANEILSMAIAYVRTNSRLTKFQEDRDTVRPGSVSVQTYESTLEIDYGVWVTPWLSVQPNLQYLIDPGGTGRISNAFVLGMHTGVTF